MRLRVQRDGIYEATNEYGYPQTYEDYGDGQGAVSVCSCCYSIVAPNRGQGTACSTCQTEDMLECELDSDMFH